jgi:predicted ATPase
MIIEKIHIKNFKRVSDISVDLRDITYLVGGNNSGKSSVLQAIHMAVSCAQRASELQQQVIAESSLRYCPTGDFQRLGNSGPYENRKDGSRGAMEFFGKTSDGADASYRIEIYKARNFHNVGVDRSGVSIGFGQFICDPLSLFSVYVPGLAGIPHHEEMQSYASVFKRAAGGEANLVFRNIIRLISEKGKLRDLEELLYDIVGPCKFKVIYNGERDLYVDVKVSFTEDNNEESYVPMDLSGTGVIQITQILAYVILFRPKILLVDEPDSHLHPSRQALLSTSFEKIVQKYECKIIVSTHSRHLVSSAPAGTKLVWLRSGKVEAQDDNGLAAMLLDLGALDQIDSSGADLLICTEDKGKKQLEDCVSSLNLPYVVRVISYNGVNNAASSAVISAMSGLFSKVPKIVIHRDRDFLTDDEVSRWGAEYISRGMEVFCPALPDMESYYISPKHVGEIYQVSENEAQTRIIEIYKRIEPSMRIKFKEKRRQANQNHWRDGGGPATSELWPDGNPMTPLTTLGKEVVPRINEDFSSAYGGRKNIYGVPSALLCAELEKFLATLSI